MGGSSFDDFSDCNGVVQLPQGAGAAAAAAVQGLMARKSGNAKPVPNSNIQGQSLSHPIRVPGGDVLLKLQHPDFTTFESMYRKLPSEGWFSPNVGPNSPIQFEIGSYTVPADTALWLTDYSFSVYRPSGIDPGDFQRAEAGRFSNQMGFDISVGNLRPSAIKYELDPQPVTRDRSAYEPKVAARATQGAFDRAAANSFASVAGLGTAVLPVRNEVQGPSGGPFTMVVGPGRVVALSCVIFRRIRAPLSAIEGRIAGYLLTNSLSDSIISQLRPV